MLLSDGANTTGRAPLQAAAEARTAKVPIYTIAYGTENGYVDLDDKREPVPVDHEEMKRIAAATNGEYFAAATADELKRVYQNIGSDIGYEKADRDRSLCRLRPGVGRSAAPRRHLARSKVADVEASLRTPRSRLLRRSPRNGRACFALGSRSRRRAASMLAKRRVLRLSKASSDSASLLPRAGAAVAARAHPAAGRSLPVAGTA